MDTVKGWLWDSAVVGSEIALTSLKETDAKGYWEALAEYKREYCGNPTRVFGTTTASDIPADGELDLTAPVSDRFDTVLHRIASTGNVKLLQKLSVKHSISSVVNNRNAQGDTPLLCAARAGHYGMTNDLIFRFYADVRIPNVAGETPLHFLSSYPDEDVPSAADDMISRSASLDVEATSFTGNAYLNPRPLCKSCPILRAVLVNRPFVLKTLLRKAREQYHNIPLSKQRGLLAWALRLHNFEILDILGEELGGSSVFRDMENIFVWTNGRRRSLVELCILGFAFPKPDSGFDMPEMFLRMLHHGSDYQLALHKSLKFIHRIKPDMLLSQCGSAANALFFAIEAGRADACRFLTDGVNSGPPTWDLMTGRGVYVNTAELFLHFNENAVARQRAELGPARRRWREAEKVFLRTFRHGTFDLAAKGIVKRDQTVRISELEGARTDSISDTSEYMEREESVNNERVVDPGGERGSGDNAGDHSMSGAIDVTDSTGDGDNESASGSNSNPNLDLHDRSGDNQSEGGDRDSMNDIDNEDHVGNSTTSIYRDDGILDEGGAIQRAHGRGGEVFVENNGSSSRMIGLAHVVLTCILHGRRGIFFQLLTGPAFEILLDSAPRYPLLFMVAIARSVHRDIHFA